MSTKKHPSQVRRRNSSILTQLPAEGRKGRAPAWPMKTQPGEVERFHWSRLWRLPQAVGWEEARSEVAVARYCILLALIETGKARSTENGEARSLEDRLGLTPKALRMLSWEIVETPGASGPTGVVRIGAFDPKAIEEAKKASSG